VLVATAEGLTEVRLVVAGDTLINENSLSLVESHLLAAALLKLVQEAAPPV